MNLPLKAKMKVILLTLLKMHPEQHQVRTDSNILMPKETEVSKAKEIPKGQKATPKLG